MITISHLTKIFEGKGPRVTALEDVNLEIGKGDIYGIIGMSGAGKSTLLRCLTLLERPTSGQIMLAGQDIASLSGAQPRAARRGMGVVFQGYNLLMQKTVAENVAFPLRLEKGYDKAAVQARVAELLAIVGLEDRAGAYPAQLSGGMQQRLAIAQAFIMQPRVLLLDEPFGALDPGIRKDMHALLLQLWGETRMTVFMVTHDLSEGFNLGTRLLVFDKVRLDPQAPNAFGDRITYDIPLNETRPSALSGTAPDNVYALRG